MDRGRSYRFLSYLLVITLPILATNLKAQTNIFAIRGTVTSANNAPIQKARISITKTPGGPTHVIVSDNNGRFVASNVSSGTYIITVSASGSAEQSREVVLPSDSSNLNFVLRPETAGSSVSGNVSSKTVRDIPLNGRSATDVATLEPGVANARTQTSGGAAQRGFGTQITISGGRPRQNDSRLDAISVNDYANSPAGSAAGVNLGVDAVEHVSVLSSNYPRAIRTIIRGNCQLFDAFRHEGFSRQCLRIH